jgi:tetratricopeptide (TPR) repeat protein
VLIGVWRSELERAMRPRRLSVRAAQIFEHELRQPVALSCHRTHGLQLVEEGLELARTVNDPWTTAEVLNDAACISYRNDLARTQALLEESLELRRRLRDQQNIADSLNNLGFAAYLQGEYERAERELEESLTLAALSPTSVTSRSRSATWRSSTSCAASKNWRRRRSYAASRGGTARSGGLSAVEDRCSRRGRREARPLLGLAAPSC